MVAQSLTVSTSANSAISARAYVILTFALLQNLQIHISFVYFEVAKPKNSLYELCTLVEDTDSPKSRIVFLYKRKVFHIQVCTSFCSLCRMVIISSLPPPSQGVRHLQNNTQAFVDANCLGSGTLYVTEE